MSSYTSCGIPSELANSHVVGHCVAESPQGGHGPSLAFAHDSLDDLATPRGQQDRRLLPAGGRPRLDHSGRRDTSGIAGAVLEDPDPARGGVHDIARRRRSGRWRAADTRHGGPGSARTGRCPPRRSRTTDRGRWNSSPRPTSRAEASASLGSRGLTCCRGPGQLPETRAVPATCPIRGHDAAPRTTGMRSYDTGPPSWAR